MLGCLESFTLVSSSCLGPVEQAGLNTSLAMVERGLGFLCRHQGERLAIFISSGGRECVRGQWRHILHCVRLANRLQSEARLHFYVFQKENCRC